MSYCRREPEAGVRTRMCHSLDDSCPDSH